MGTPQDQIAAQILHSKSLPISQSWLNNFVTTSHILERNIPLSAVTQTALFRVLASDIQQTLSTRNPASLFPRDIVDPRIQERKLQGPIPVQVLDVEDIGTSVWSQVEGIERVERGEAIRGREIVRTVNVDGDDEDREQNDNANGATAGGAAGVSAGPHRLTLQDAAGNKVVGIELKRIGDVTVGKLAIGAKALLKNATVARGMILLAPECVTLLGGKIEYLDRAWRDRRKLCLKARIEEMAREENEMNGPDAMEE